MKVLDIKFYDKQYLDKFYKLLDNHLLNCLSFEEQKQLLLDEYNKKTFCRDSLIYRQKQLENSFECGYEKYLYFGFNIFLPFVGSGLIYFNDKGYLASIVFLCIALLNIFFFVRTAKKRIQEPDVGLYEIRNFEIDLLKRLLNQDMNEIDLLSTIE